MESTFIITSPNPQFTEMAKSVSKELALDSIIIESILEDAVEQVLKCSREHDISAIISRGSTAAMIRKNTDIPVLVAEATSFDILISLMEAMKISNRIAYVQYEKDTNEDLSIILDSLKIQVKKYYFITKLDMEQAVYQAFLDGNKVVVCGSTAAQELSEKVGLPGICVNTSKYTMKEILAHAELIQYVQNRDSYHRNQLNTVLNFVPDGILYLDDHNQVTVINRVGLELLNIKEDREILGKPITDLIHTYEFIDIINGRNYESGKVVNFSGKEVVVRSSPVYVKESYIGSVLSIQNSAYISKLDQKVRRQAMTIGMAAFSTFKDIENTTCSKTMLECINKAKLFAQTDSTILITGESGSGKEIFAQSIHNASSRCKQPFVALNCAALSQNLLESELFGYEEGAFTGAKRGGRAGYFELAHNGTLFLDELGLLPLHVQVQLLRVLQERQVLRIGGVKMIPINIRIIAATNANLLSSVENGTFRHDLFYRLNVLNIAIPPLRQRKEDIPALIQHYLTLYNAQYNKQIKFCSEDFINAFQNHDWPGNVRELMNYLMRIIILSKNEILTFNDINKCGINFASIKQAPEPAVSLKNDSINLYPDTLEALERKIILWYMDYYKGNRAEVCNALKISRTTLWKKLKKGT